jgi:hypothetical protein
MNTDYRLVGLQSGPLSMCMTKLNYLRETACALKTRNYIGRTDLHELIIRISGTASVAF